MVGRTPEYLGKKIEARRDEAGHAGPADPSDHDPGADRAVLATGLGPQGRRTTPARTASRKSCTSSARRRPTTARASRDWGTPRASTDSSEDNPAAGPVQRVLGHCHRPGDAAGPLHSDHRAAGAGGQPGGQESRRRSPAGTLQHRHVDVRLMSCWAPSSWSGRCCSCRRRCWGPSPSTGSDSVRWLSLAAQSTLECGELSRSSFEPT